MNVEQRQEREVLDRILARGDLTVLGLPVGDIGTIYKLVAEWRSIGGQERWIRDHTERERLAARVETLEGALCVIEGMAARVVEPRRVKDEILAEVVRVLGVAPQ